MKGRSVLVALGLVVVSCTTGVEPPSSSVTTTTSGPATSTTRRPTTTTSSLVATTTTSTPSIVDLAALPDGPCQIDDVPEGGEPTVVVGDRLYGLGADLATPRCLMEGVSSANLAWGPLGDRLITGHTVHGQDFETLSFEDAASLEWTAPTGSKVVVVGGDRLTKVSLDGSGEENIRFLDETESVAYHPAGTHMLAVGTDAFDQYGLWFASNDGVDFQLIAFDEEATIAEPEWSWLNEPLFVANHDDDHWHIHRVELVDGDFQGPVVVESDLPIDWLTASPYDPVMIGYREGGEPGAVCTEGAAARVRGIDLPEPLMSYTSTPVGWLSLERLLVLAFPAGCLGEADLWSFSAGFCPGSTYGAELLISGIDGAAQREAMPTAPPAPDFSGVIDPAPA